MSLRIDDLLLTVYIRLGMAGVAVSIAILAYACFGNLVRGFGLSVFLLIAAQAWPSWLITQGRLFRYWVLIILCLRGISLAVRTPAPPWEPRGARHVAFWLAFVALASCLWADNFVFAFGIAATFAALIAATFWVVWRMMDREDLLGRACKGTLILAIVFFGGSFVWAGYAHLTGDAWTLVRMDWGGRFTGMMWNANMMGLLGMIVIPPLVASSREVLGGLAILRWPALVAAAAGVWLSGSRTSLTGTVVALVIIFCYRFGAGALLTVVLGSAGVFIVAMNTTAEEFDTGAFSRFARTKHLSTLSGRMELWQEGFDAVQGRELIGLGWGTSRLLGGADADEAIERGFIKKATNLHSTYVQMLVDAGILGVSLLLLLAFQVLFAGWRLLLMPQTPRTTAAVMVLACFVACFADTWVHGGILTAGSPSSIIYWTAAVFVLRESAFARLALMAPPPARAATPALAGHVA